MSIKRIVGKETTQYTLAEYSNVLSTSTVARKQSEIGEIVIDIGGNPANPTVYVANAEGKLNPLGGGGSVLSVPPVYFTTLTGGNNQQFTDSVLTVYSSNIDITAFHNGVLMENTLYTLQGDTLTVNIVLQPNDNIEIISKVISGNAQAAISIPPVYFVANTDGNNQQFSNAYLAAYTSNTDITLFHNGVFVENTNFRLVGDTLIVDVPLNTGDSIDVARQFAASVIEQPTLSIPAMYFIATGAGNNQTFSNVYLSGYTSNTDVTAFKNGVLLESQNYELNDDTLTVNVPLLPNDTIEIIRQFASSVINIAGVPAGPVYSLQYNNNGEFAGVPGVEYLLDTLILGNVGNISIAGGEDGQVLTTDGTGGLRWDSPSRGFRTIPAMYFEAPTNGNNQTFSNTFLTSYSSNNDLTVFLNGSLLENGFYTLVGDTMTVTTPISIGDSIDILGKIATSPSTVTTYIAGQVIRTYMYGWSELGQSASSTVSNNASYQTIASHTYTPASNNSYLVIEYVTPYTTPVSSTVDTDEWYSQISVNGTEVGVGSQLRRDFVDVSGSLFPVSGRYLNASTETKTIQIRVRSGTAAGPLQVTGSVGTWMKITEIAR